MDVNQLQLPADPAMFSQGKLQSLLEQHETLAKEETVRLQHLQWLTEVHKKVVGDAEHRLNVRNDLVLELKDAIHAGDREAEKLKEISGPTNFLSEQAASSGAVYTRTMTSGLFQAQTENLRAGQHSRPSNELIQPQHTPPCDRATQFGPIDADPRDLFVIDADELQQYGQWTKSKARMIRRDAPKDEILIFVHGYCGLPHSTRSGCAVVHRPTSRPYNASDGHLLAFCLESCGPTGELHPASEERAHLRAAIAALEHADLADEGWLRVTVASCSFTLVNGITNKITDWQQQGWRHVISGEPVENRDMWERLLALVNKYASEGVEVRFWLVGKHLNKGARKEAKKVSKTGKTRKAYTTRSANGSR